MAGEKKNDGLPFSYVLYGVLAILVVAAIYLLMQDNTAYGGELELSSKEVSNYEGNFKLLNAANISLVMDVRGLSQENKVSVFQCGVGFASSLGRIGKNVTNFAIEDDGCYGPLNRTSIAKCSELAHKDEYMIVLKGGKADAKYYEDYLLVVVPEKNTEPCGINIAQQK